MLSDDLREMRREFQNALLKGNDSFIFTGEQLQSYALALVIYEDAALDMEEILGLRVATTDVTHSEVIPLPLSHKKRPQLTVIHGGGDDVA